MTELAGSSVVSCARKTRSSRGRRTPTRQQCQRRSRHHTGVRLILQINIVDSHRSRFAVDVARPDIALRADRLVGSAAVVVQTASSCLAPVRISTSEPVERNTGVAAVATAAAFGLRSGRVIAQEETRTPISSSQAAQTQQPSRGFQRPRTARCAHARAGFQSQPDIRAHVRRQKIPVQIGKSRVRQLRAQIPIFRDSLLASAHVRTCRSSRKR